MPSTEKSYYQKGEIVMNFAVNTMKRCQEKQRRAKRGRLFVIPFWHSTAILGS